MGTDRYAAFLSYAHRYKEWVAVLHGHLEQCLDGEVFLDQVDLGSGRSWVGQIEEGLGKAEHMVLVATPEALASPWVSTERTAFMADRPGFDQGKLHIVKLVDVPLPPLLSQIGWVDFTEHDEAKYHRGLRELLGGLLGKADKRALPELPAGLEAPATPDPGLPPELRGELVKWLAPILERRVNRRAVEAALGFKHTSLDSYPGWDCAASAALVHATGDDDAVAAALRITGVLAEELEEDEPQRVAELGPIRERLEALGREGPVRGLVRTWLTCVASDHDRLVPYFQQQAELDLLDRVYVQLDLRPESRRVRPRKEAELHLERSLGIRQVLQLDRDEHPWITRRWVVLGDPGAGKTTLVRHLAASLAREAQPPWVPVLESLPRLMREREWLLDRIARRLERAGTPARGFPAVLDQAGRDGRLLLLLDGLDEVPREDREDAERLLRDLSTRWPETPLVLTSRPIGYRRPDSDFVELELQPLERERRREFLARWFGRGGAEPEWERAGEALAVLEAEPSLFEISGNPLYLTLMALLLEQGTSPERNRTRLYDQIFELLLEGQHRLPPQPMDAKKPVRRVLRHLAWAMTRDNRDAEPRDDLEARLYLPEMDELREPLERIPRWRRSLRPFLDELAERTGIVGAHDGPEADWRFWHRTFREALTAERLEELWSDGGEAAVLAHARQIEGDESRWAESFALLAGRVGKRPDALVKALVAENRALGLRALATAQGLEEETVSEVLELTGEWKERSKVYPRIPELVGDGEKTLQLLDRLRRRTRSGNDLFFLDLAVRGVGRRWPEQERASRELRGRLFDHIPAPPEGLFEWVETAKGERVELWCEVPAGEFWMGRPEGEKGYNDELPRHRVEITEGFRIAAVPVTNAQYRAFDPEHRWETWEGVSEEELAHHPVVNVTWYQAMAFCRWLSVAVPGLAGARLATEEEWEYAARAGTETAYWRGDGEKALGEVGWYDANSGNRTHRVAELPANPWGLYDVHGNIDEWTLSEWTDDYQGREDGAPHQPSTIDADERVPDDPSGVWRVIRGGSFRDVAVNARSAFRDWDEPRDRWVYQGFRVVVPVAPSRSMTDR